MKKITTIKVAHLWVEVWETPVPKCPKKRTEYRGYFHYPTKRIVLSSTVPPGERLELLLHEIMHAGLWAYGHTSDRFTEEDLCCVSGRILAAVLLDNQTALGSYMQALITGHAAGAPE